MSARVRFALLAAVLTLAGTAACAPEDEAAPPAASGTASASADACAKDQLQLVTAGKFTVGTDKPAYSPWFVDDDPTNGKGFESAVAYAVAEELGFASSEVSWIVVPFTNAYAPGDKKFDVDINQVSITEARRKAVDFSSGYYDVAQTVVSVKGSKIDGKTSIADLKDAKLGAQVGTTSYTAITDQIQATAKPAVFDTNDLAVQALKNGQVDAANIFSTDPSIAENEFVQLEDTKKLFGSQNIVPLVRADRADEVRDALNAVSAKLTTESIAQMLKQTDIDKKDPKAVAQEFLAANGLA